MLKYFNYIFLLSVIISCDFKETEERLIEKNSLDVEFNLVNGILIYKGKSYSGIVKEFYTEGNIKTKSQYFNGKRNGYYNGWYKNGNKWFERFYTKGLKTGTHLGWYTNKQPMFVFHFNKAGNYNGENKEWYANGILAKVFSFKNGKEDGIQKMWDLKGKIKSNFVTKKGERFGLIGLKKCYSIDIKNEERK